MVNFVPDARVSSTHTLQRTTASLTAAFNEFSQTLGAGKRMKGNAAKEQTHSLSV